VTASLEGIVGWFDESNAVAGDDDDVYFGGSLSLSYALTDSITITPHATALFSDNLGDRIFGGVGASFSF
jgi:hypothetical protein